jgi:hypothetical protein
VDGGGSLSGRRRRGDATVTSWTGTRGCRVCERRAKRYASQAACRRDVQGGTYLVNNSGRSQRSRRPFPAMTTARPHSVQSRANCAGSGNSSLTAGRRIAAQLEIRADVPASLALLVGGLPNSGTPSGRKTLPNRSVRAADEGMCIFSPQIVRTIVCRGLTESPIGGAGGDGSHGTYPAAAPSGNSHVCLLLKPSAMRHGSHAAV